MSKVFVGVVFTVVCFGQNAPLLNILNEELQRNFEMMKKADPGAYFMSYGVVEQQNEVFSAAYGALQTSNRNHTRTLDVSIRVGTPKLDNYRSVRGDRPQFSAPTALPIEDNGPAIRRRVWAETDRTFRRASQRLINLRTSTQVNLAAADASDDFSSEKPSVYVAPPTRFSVNRGEWEDRVRRWSGEFRKYPGVLASGVSVGLLNETKYLVNTEGTRLTHGRGYSRITIMAQGKAVDGMDLLATHSFEAELPSDLAADKAVLGAVEQVAKDLTRLVQAPVVDPFVGPAILSGRAAAVFFHEIFGHRIEGHRQKDDTDGQTFTKSLNQPVLPPFLSVVFDPTRREIGGIQLYGNYAYDDEGVQARPVTVVDKGVLKTFLVSRTPIQGFPHSNGHGRKQAGLEVVSRQSNLIVQSARQTSEKQLRQMLLDEIKRQGKPYGFYFDQVTGGFTTTGRAGLQAFKVIPLIVYRVYPDGRPDEMVRGVDIVGTPLASFAKILATGDTAEVFNGYCGAESGSVPVSAVSPPLLVSEIEIQRKERANDRPPLLPPPPASEGGVQ